MKLLKGISFLPATLCNVDAIQLRDKCVDFILLHEVCYQSHQLDAFLHTNIKHLTFPNMYQSDFLEILWTLKRVEVVDARMNRALALLKKKQQPDGTWHLEKPNAKMVITLGKTSVASVYVTQRAQEIIKYYHYSLYNNRELENG